MEGTILDELDEYIIQKFPSNKTGRLESHLAYKCRLFWIRNDFPTAKVVAEACGTTAGNVKNYKDYYNWKKIQDHIVFLREKEKQEKFSQYQEDTIKNLQDINKQRTGVLIYRLDYLLKEVGAGENNVPNPNLTIKDIEKCWEEIYTINRLLSQIQKDRLRDAGLPEHINDKLPVEAEINSNADISLVQGKSKEEVDKEYEDTIKKYIDERINKEK